MSKILIVDDEIGIRELLSEILRDEGHDIVLAENAASARLARNESKPDLILLDIWMPDTDGITLLKEWAVNGLLTVPIIMMSGHGTIDTAVEATRIGAIDYLEKPISLQKLLLSVKRGLQRSRPASLIHPLTLSTLNHSPAIKEFKKKLDQASKNSRIVFLKVGQGNLSEFIARSIQPINTQWIDLTTISEPIEITALSDRKGGFIWVPELRLLNRVQQKNLIFIFEKIEKFNLNVVVATESSKENLIEEGWEESFISKLFETGLVVPSIFDIKDDIPELALQTLQYLIDLGEIPKRTLTTAALNLLQTQTWLGGYPELRSTIKSLALTTLEEEIDIIDIKQLLSSKKENKINSILPLDLPLREAREIFERIYFEHHLKQELGNMTRLAEKTGLERTHLYRKLKSLGLSSTKKSSGH